MAQAVLSTPQALTPSRVYDLTCSSHESLLAWFLFLFSAKCLVSTGLYTLIPPSVHY